MEKTKLLTFGLAVATYNEAANISHLLEKISQEFSKVNDVAFEVLVVDDSSPDGTAELARKSAQKLNRESFHISVLVRLVKDGLGRAYIAGFTHLMNRG